MPNTRAQLLAAFLLLPSTLLACAAGDMRGLDDDLPTLEHDQAEPPRDDSTDTGAEGSEASDDGPADACEPATHRCASVPPLWSGPVVRVQSPADAAQTSCAGDWPDPFVIAYAGLAAAPAACECSCGAPQAGACAATTTVRAYDEFCWGDTCHNADGCEIVTMAIDVVEGTSSSLDAALPSRFVADAPAASGGDCVPSAPTLVPALAPTFTDRIEGCSAAPELTSACDNGGTCVPAPPAGQALCIWNDGDRDCPEAWPDKLVVHREWADERTCTACDCAEPQGRGCPDATLSFGDGLVLVDTLAADSSCHLVDGAPPYDPDQVTFDPGEPQGGSCSPMPGEVVGEVVPAEPITLCCGA